MYNAILYIVESNNREHLISFSDDFDMAKEYLEHYGGKLFMINVKETDRMLLMEREEKE